MKVAQMMILNQQCTMGQLVVLMFSKRELASKSICTTLVRQLKMSLWRKKRKKKSSQKTTERQLLAPKSLMIFSPELLG
jgi:hypothetical protein